MQFEKGQQYYYMSQKKHELIIGKEHFESFVSCTYLDNDGDPAHGFNLYVFKKENWQCIALTEDNAEQQIFKNQDEILKYLQKHIQFLGEPYDFDDYLKEKIKDSQEKFPERWI